MCLTIIVILIYSYNTKHIQHTLIGFVTFFEYKVILNEILISPL